VYTIVVMLCSSNNLLIDNRVSSPPNCGSRAVPFLLPSVSTVELAFVIWSRGLFQLLLYNLNRFRHCLSSGFQPRLLSYDSHIGTCILDFSMLKVNIATSLLCLYSTIFAEFSWYLEALVLKPISILAHSNKLPAFKSSSSFLWYAC